MIFDVAVVGGGVAGVLAALDAHARGANVALVARDDGASGATSGAWDGLGSGARGLVESATVRDFIGARTSLHAALARLVALAPNVLVLPGLDEALPLVVSELGVARRALAHDPAQLDLRRLPRARVAVASLAGHPSFEARAVARTLDRQALREGDARRFTAVEIDFMRRGRDRVLHPHELAAVLDLDPTDARRGRDARYVLTEGIRSAIGGFSLDAVLLPPILGLRSDDVRSELEAALGLPIGEAVAHLPGAPGMRLMRRLHAALEREPERMTVHRDRVTRVRKVGADVELGLALAKKTPIVAHALIVATGKRLGGGITVPPEGGLAETLLTAGLFDRGERVGASRPATPLSGLGLDDEGRVRALPSTLHGASIFACGAVLEGLDATGAASGLAEIAESALAASRHAFPG